MNAQGHDRTRTSTATPKAPGAQARSRRLRNRIANLARPILGAPRQRPRRVGLGLLALVGLALSGCVLMPKQQAAALEEKARGYESASRALQGDTDLSELARFLDEMRAEEGRLNETIAQLESDAKIDARQAEQLKKTHGQLRSLQVQKTRAILDNYHEYTVDFHHLNRWKLLPESIQRLSAIDWDRHCPTTRKVIVYGYGDPIGGYQPTLMISEGRAYSVVQWLEANTRCKRTDMVARGLGVDVKAEEIDRSNLPQDQKLEIYKKSRYARILVPKAPTD